MPLPMVIHETVLYCIFQRPSIAMRPGCPVDLGAQDPMQGTWRHVPIASIAQGHKDPQVDERKACFDRSCTARTRACGGCFRPIFLKDNDGQMIAGCWPWRVSRCSEGSESSRPLAGPGCPDPQGPRL
jgi:hypothetical protein